MSPHASHDNTPFADPHLESLLPATQSNRRGFLAAASTVGFALAAGPVNAQSVIRTPADGLDAGDLTVQVGSEKMPAYMAAPAKAGKYPVVIVVPEIFGMHEYQKDICRRLAKLGYVGITLDPFFRLGDLTKISNIGEVVGLANKLDDTQMLADLDALVAFVSKQPKANAKKIGITGMCRGGRTVWMFTAHNPAIKAGVSWYGGLNAVPVTMPKTPHDVAAGLHAPVLGLYGGADSGIPVAEVARLQEVLKAGNKNAQASRFVLYPGVGHAFHADYRPSYRKEAAEDGWQQMLAWFKANGVA
ncbi:MAG: dienelactone hydrolase family protein [Burkholderiaceae bacterium]|nr:dienelactone hydrolase family protein [Burkholderiaceae bacterium]